MLNVKNGQAWDLNQIPLWDQDKFRRGILEECRSEARLVNLFVYPEKDGGMRIAALLGRDDESKLFICSMRVSKENPFYQSLTPELPQAHSFEREIAEQYAISVVGHPWLKPLRCHQNDPRAPGQYPFFQLKGEEVHEVAVGPIHAGTIEPGHFRFQCHGEEILYLEIQLGYQHRGIEKLMEGAAFSRAVLLAESIAGDTVIGHALCYCALIESLSGCEISIRAQALRAFALELERLANHIGDLGALGADIGFLPTAAYFGRLRGEFLNLLMELTGNRYGRSFCRPGGVCFDVDSRLADHFRRRLLKAKEELKEIADLFFMKPSVLSRLEGVGEVDRDTAKQLGLVGPAARASGCGRDTRMDYAFGMYRFHHIPISLTDTGDVYARALIRWLEAQRSLDFILELLDQIPPGALRVSLGPLAPGVMALAMVEGWRGEIVHVMMTDEHSQIQRYKIKDPSFNNWTALSWAVRGMQISDFPLCNKSFNLSYAGHDL